MQKTQETGVRSLGQKDQLEKEMATHSSIRGAWWATLLRVAEARNDLMTKQQLPTIYQLCDLGQVALLLGP